MEPARHSFTGLTYGDHVNAAIICIEGIAAHLWMLSAVCASLERVHGQGTVSKFASDIGRSARSVRELAQTYRVWSTPERSGERSPVLSFRHHTLATRSKDPVRAIRFAEDQELSSRQFEAWLAHENEREEVEAVVEGDTAVVGEEEQEYGYWKRCPLCEGVGRVWKED